MGGEAGVGWGDMENPERQVGCVWRGGWRSMDRAQPPNVWGGADEAWTVNYMSSSLPSLRSGALSWRGDAHPLGGKFGVLFLQQALRAFLLKRTEAPGRCVWWRRGSPSCSISRS